MKHNFAILSVITVTLLSSASAPAQQYRLERLEPAAGGDQCWAADINNASQILGSSHQNGTATLSPVLWDGGAGTVFDQYYFGNPYETGFGLALNDSGLLVGMWHAPNFPFGGTRANFVSSLNLAPNILEFLSGDRPGAALDVNMFGVAVGWMSDRTIVDDMAVQRAYLSVVNDNPSDALPVGVDLGTLGGLFSQATGINSLGQIVGWSLTTAGPSRAFLYDQGVMSDLGTLPGGMASEASDINDAGEIVGWSFDQDNERHAFLYRQGVMSDLGTLGGTVSKARSVNSLGQIIGESWDEDGDPRAFLFDPINQTMSDLNDLVEPGHGWTLQSADAVNDLGEIVGRGLNEAGEVRGFCLRPTSLRLMPPDPGLAGQPNAVAVSQATPYQTIYLVGSLLTGSTPIPGCGGGVSLDLANPVVLGIGAAGDRGRATFTIYVPAGLAGVEVHLQAVELANCRISNRQTFRF